MTPTTPVEFVAWLRERETYYADLAIGSSDGYWPSRYDEAAKIYELISNKAEQ